MRDPIGPPSTDGPGFVEWLRAETEARWAIHVPRDYHAAGVGGLDWATGTRWRGGLADSKIDQVERRFGLVFPPDYRRFLTTLHTTDPAMVGAAWEGSRLVARTGRQLTDWEGDADVIGDRLAWPVSGLLWSIEADGVWLSSWGPRPDTEHGRAEAVRALAAAGPPLIPVFGHRYLVGMPLAEGNPVLSIYGADVIVLADNLASWLAHELTGRPARVTHPPVGGDSLGLWRNLILDEQP